MVNFRVFIVWYLKFLNLALYCHLFCVKYLFTSIQIVLHPEIRTHLCSPVSETNVYNGLRVWPEDNNHFNRFSILFAERTDHYFVFMKTIIEKVMKNCTFVDLGKTSVVYRYDIWLKRIKKYKILTELQEICNLYECNRNRISLFRSMPMLSRFFFTVSEIDILHIYLCVLPTIDCEKTMDFMCLPIKMLSVLWVNIDNGNKLRCVSRAKQVCLFDVLRFFHKTVEYLEHMGRMAWGSIN